MFVSCGLPVTPPPPLSWQDKGTANIFQTYACCMCTKAQMIPPFVISHCFLLEWKSTPSALRVRKKQKHTSQSQRQRDKERPCPHHVTDISNTSNPSLISYILLHCRVHLCLEIAFIDLLLFVALCVSVHFCSYFFTMSHNLSEYKPNPKFVLISVPLLLWCGGDNSKCSMNCRVTSPAAFWTVSCQLALETSNSQNHQQDTYANGYDLLFAFLNCNFVLEK